MLLPRLANALTNAWEPRDPEPALRFLEAWAELLPLGVQRHVLDTLILPKVGGFCWSIKRAVLVCCAACWTRSSCPRWGKVAGPSNVLCWCASQKLRFAKNRCLRDVLDTPILPKVRPQNPGAQGVVMRCRGHLTVLDTLILPKMGVLVGLLVSTGSALGHQRLHAGMLGTRRTLPGQVFLVACWNGTCHADAPGGACTAVYSHSGLQMVGFRHLSSTFLCLIVYSSTLATHLSAMPCHARACMGVGRVGAARGARAAACGHGGPPCVRLTLALRLTWLPRAADAGGGRMGAARGGACRCVCAWWSPLHAAYSGSAPDLA